MSLFSTMGIGVSGLQTSQLGMDISGQNISNADVQGYSRKRLNVSAAYRKDEGFGQMGFGVEVKNIERMRNAFLDQQIQNQNQEVGTYEQHSTVLERIENIFTEPGTTGLQNFMDQFFDSWQNLASNPADPAARNLVKTTAESMINVFQNLSGELRNIRDSMNQEIQGRVDTINKDIKDIYNLNKEIGAVEISGQNANDSRDRRDNLIKELSKLVDVTVTENKQGQVSLSTSGSLLVSPVFYQELETYSTNEVKADGTTQVSFAVRFKDSKVPLIPKAGELKGLFDCRDQIIPAYQDKLDSLANGLVAKVNEVHQRGYNLMGFSGINFFNSDVTGASDIALSQSVISDVNNIAAAGGGATAKVTNTIVAPPALNFGSAPLSLPKVAGPVPPVPAGQAVARNLVTGTVLVHNGGVLLREGVDYRIDYPMGTIQMLNNLNDGAPITLDYEYNTGAFKGPGDNGSAIALAQLRQNATMNANTVGAPTSTFTEYYSAFIGQLGLKRNEADSNLKTRQFLVEQYQTNQDAISGVSLDEEMANLVKYQHTYSAAARLISITSEMLNTLINM